MTSIFFFFLWDCTCGQVDRTGVGTKQPLQASLCPYPIALLKKRDRVGCWWSMLCWQEEWQVEIGLLASSKCAFVHAQGTSVLTECGRKGELSSPLPSSPMEDLPLRRTACDRFPSAENIIWGWHSVDALGFPVTSGPGRLPSHHLQLQIKEELQKHAGKIPS